MQRRVEFQCSGEMRRYVEEYRWRRRLSGVTDAQARKRGEQTGLDTLVVHAVNDECLGVGAFPALVP